MPVPSSRSAITEPVPLGLRRLLRTAVVEHATSEPRRVFAPVLHVGLPGRGRTDLDLDAATVVDLDAALRVDVLQAMVRRVRRPGSPSLVWLTRAPSSEAPDLDHAWHGAARAAAGELGVGLPMVVVTRRGWCDPGTGVGQQWRRVRVPPGRHAPDDEPR